MSKEILKVFNELIETIEKSSTNNEAVITNVKLWAESWKKEMEAFKEQLRIANVSGSLLSDLDYWKQRCELAEKCLEESPCDPDITSDQIKVHNTYNKFISNFGNDR